MLQYIGWQISYFDYWLMHMFYFAAGLIIIIAIGSNKYMYYKNRMMILKRLEKYSYPARELEKWLILG